MVLPQAVVGEFMGTATFQGVTITSNDFTADMFVMRLDRTTGAQQWIRQGGGSEGADRPYGVTIAPNGQVTVAGEFKGTASWDDNIVAAARQLRTEIAAVVA